MVASHTPTPSVAAIGGHPLHPMLVPVPIVATVLTLGCDVAARVTGDARFAWGSRWLLRVAVAGGALAAPMGTIDALAIRSPQTARLGWAHGAINAAVLTLVAAESIARGAGPIRALEARPWVTGLAVGLLGVSGWLGGELAYRRGVGVDLRRPGLARRVRPHAPAEAHAFAPSRAITAAPSAIRDEAIDIIARTWPDGSTPDEVAAALRRIEEAAASPATASRDVRGRVLEDLGTIHEAAALVSS
jgi:uncharacterized membrane protein